MGKRQTLSTSDPPRKLRFGIKPLENDVLAPHAAASGPPSSLAASVKRMLQNGVNSAGDRRSMAGVEERGKAEELAPQQVSEEILSDGPEEDFRFATPLGPRLQAAASFVEQAGDAGIASASIAPGPQGLSAQQQFIANLLAPGETPLTTPMTKGGGPISRHALGPQLQRLLQEDRACYSKAGRRMKHGSPLELKCISMKVEGHLQMWWCNLHKPGKSINDEQVLLLLNADWHQGLSEGHHIAVRKPHHRVTVGKIQVIIASCEASIVFIPP